MPSDWKFDSREMDADSSSEAYAVEGGVVHDLDVSAAGNWTSHSDSSSSHHESAASATGHPTEFTHLVSAKLMLKVSARNTKTGCASHGKASGGARMVKHYEANKSGRATGMLKLTAGSSGPSPDKHPEDTLTVVAGSSQISATYSRSSGEWSLYGSLRTSTGVQTINQQVEGFENLDEEFAFNQAIQRGSNFTIAAKVNDGNIGDQYHQSSTGSTTISEDEMHCYAILDTVISPDH